MAAGLHRLGVKALRAACAAGQVSVVAAIDHHLARIERFDGALGAFTFVDAAGARAAALASAARFEAGTARPLEGVPIAIKGNIDVAGWPVAAGTGALRDRRADRDAAVVGRLRAAGAILIGLTNLHEGALGATTDNPFYGRTQNPYRAGYTPGGSSGGSAAAVAAGLCTAALGTDTLGSIRIPASYCGIAGLKPGPGRVPADGLIPLVPEWDVIGPLARSVADCAALFDVLADGAPAAPVARVATLTGWRGAETDPVVDAAVRLAASVLEGLGIEVRSRSAPLDFDRLRLAGFLEASAGARAHFGALADRDPSGFSEAFLGYLQFAAGIDRTARAQGQKAIGIATTEIRGLLRLADAILLPATPQAAFPHGTQGPATLADFTSLASFAGLPALVLPAGWTSDGLPIGVQLIGREGGEAALLSLGQRLETALNAQRPPAAYT